MRRARGVQIEWGTVWFFVLAAWLLATGAAAQACLGFPQGSRGALSASFGFPEDATSYAMAGMVASQEGSVFFQGSFGIAAPDIEQLENVKQVGGVVAYEVPSLAPGASVCPTAAVSHAWVGDVNTWTIPFGVGVGTTIKLGREGAAGLTPFVVPQFLYVRASLDDVEDSEESDVFIGLGAGATLHVGAFMVGGGVSKIFEEDVDAVFSVVVGVAWR